MPRDRFFVEGVHAAGSRVSLAADDARKLVTVLRAQTGDRVEIVDGAGAVFAGRLEVEGRAVHAILGQAQIRSPDESASRIVIAQAIPKGQKMDFIVEKATELGVAEIVPLRSDRVIGDRTGERKTERWQRIAKTAAQQSGRVRIPLIAAETDWPGLIAMFATFECVFVPWERAAPRPLREIFEGRARTAASLLFAIGPEGGFSSAEVERAQAAGAVPISLGPRILRTETAALVVLATLAYARGEL